MTTRYRHGVLIENYVEDQFGIDLLERNVATTLLFLIVTKVNEKTPLSNNTA